MRHGRRGRVFQPRPHLASAAVCAAAVPEPEPAAVVLCQVRSPASVHSAGLSAERLGPPAAAAAHKPVGAADLGQPAGHQYTKQTVRYLVFLGSHQRHSFAHWYVHFSHGSHAWMPTDLVPCPRPFFKRHGVVQVPCVCARRGMWTCSQCIRCFSWQQLTWILSRAASS